MEHQRMVQTSMTSQAQCLIHPGCFCCVREEGKGKGEKKGKKNGGRTVEWGSDEEAVRLCGWRRFGTNLKVEKKQYVEK